MDDITEHLDRMARITPLDIGEHRPRSVQAALRRDEIAQDLLYGKALKQKREALARELGRAYAFRALKRVEPERRRMIEASARAFAEWYFATIQ